MIVTFARCCASALTAGLLWALTGCTTAIPGEPVPAAGFHDPPEQWSSSEAAVPVPRATDGFDPCQLLTQQELAVAGGGTGVSHPDNPLPGVCSFPLAGELGNTAAVGFHEAYESAPQRQPRGVRTEVEGHSVWLYCEVVETYQTCTATTAIRRDRSLLTMLSVRNASAADVSDMLFHLTKAALHKLPPG